MPHYNVNPTDGALFANGFAVGAQHQKAWESERERIQRIRGEVLSAVFEIESSIDYAIGDCMLPRVTIRSPSSLAKRHYLCNTANCFVGAESRRQRIRSWK